MTIDDVKVYLRIDSNDDDALLQSLMTAAISYINKMTGKKQVVNGTNADGTLILSDIATDELWSMAVKLLIAHWYENRAVEVAGNLNKISHSVDALVNHIAMCGDYV